MEDGSQSGKIKKKLCYIIQISLVNESWENVIIIRYFGKINLNLINLLKMKFFEVIYISILMYT